MKLSMHPISLNGNFLPRDRFGYALKAGCGFESAGVDAIHYWCPNKNRICAVHLTLGKQEDGGTDSQRRWHWDGNMEAPTIEPSIGCHCGWHGNITAGERKP